MPPVQITELVPAEAAVHLSTGATRVVLVDVRELDEWEAGHAPDAVHVPLSSFDPTALPDAETLLCICRSGARSTQVVAALVQMGRQAVNVRGGMQAWHADGYEVVDDAGGAGVVI